MLNVLFYDIFPLSYIVLKKIKKNYRALFISIGYPATFLSKKDPATNIIPHDKIPNNKVSNNTSFSIILPKTSIIRDPIIKSNPIKKNCILFLEFPVLLLIPKLYIENVE